MAEHPVDEASAGEERARERERARACRRAAEKGGEREEGGERDRAHAREGRPAGERGAARRGATAERADQARLTFRRLTGLDRSGPPPSQTLRDQPWNVKTIPNAIGFVRLALIPAFVVLALGSDSGTDALPAVIFAVISWSDYFDGMAARLTGQYSRFGALLDPFVDRLLVVAGLGVCWYFELLPRWAIALLVARELFLLIAGNLALRKGYELKINWPGRAAVWPTMSAIFFGLVGLLTLAAALLFVGLVLSYVAVVLYVRDGLDQLRASRAAET